MALWGLVLGAIAPRRAGAQDSGVLDGGGMCTSHAQCSPGTVVWNDLTGVTFGGTTVTAPITADGGTYRIEMSVNNPTGATLVSYVPPRSPPFTSSRLGGRTIQGPGLQVVDLRPRTNNPEAGMPRAGATGTLTFDFPAPPGAWRYILGVEGTGDAHGEGPTRIVSSVPLELLGQADVFETRRYARLQPDQVTITGTASRTADMTTGNDGFSYFLLPENVGRTGGPSRVTFTLTDDSLPGSRDSHGYVIGMINPQTLESCRPPPRGATAGTLGTCVVNYCGDGIVRGGEACDDGNDVAGDGCSATCAVEPGVVCTGTTPSVCVTPTICYTGGVSTALQLNPEGSINGPRYDPDAGTLVLNQAAAYQVGSVFARTPLSASNNLHAFFHLDIRTMNPPGGDGVAFVMQNMQTPQRETRGMGPTALGQEGAGIGYGGISPSVAIEFDTVRNTGGEGDDPDNNHIALTLNGNHRVHTVLRNDAQLRALMIDIRSTPMNVWIEYTVSRTLLQVYVAPEAVTNRPATPLFEHTIDLARHFAQDGGTSGQFYVGVTGSTGIWYSQHTIRSLVMTSEGPEFTTARPTVRNCPFAGDAGVPSDGSVDAAVAMDASAGADVTTSADASPSIGDPMLCFNATTNDANLVLGGTASKDAMTSQIVLVNERGNTTGSVFHRTPVPTNRDLDAFISVEMSSGAASGSGLAFVIQRDARGAETTSSLQGTELGDGAIRPRVGVALNTDGNRVSVGSDSSGQVATFGQSFLGTVTNVWMTYRVATHEFAVYVSRDATRPATPTVRRMIDLQAALGNISAFVGFTAVNRAASGTMAGPRIAVRQFSASSQPITTTVTSCPAACTPTPAPTPAGGCAVGLTHTAPSPVRALCLLAVLALVLVARRRRP